MNVVREYGLVSVARTWIEIVLQVFANAKRATCPFPIFLSVLLCVARVVVMVVELLHYPVYISVHSVQSVHCSDNYIY